MFFVSLWIQKLMFYISFWVQKLIHNITFWIQNFFYQKLTFSNTFRIQKLMFYVSFWVQKLIHNISFWFIAVYHVRIDIMFKTLFKNIQSVLVLLFSCKGKGSLYKKKTEIYFML